MTPYTREEREKAARKSRLPPLTGRLDFKGGRRLKWDAAKENAMLEKAVAALQSGGDDDDRINFIAAISTEDLPTDRAHALNEGVCQIAAERESQLRDTIYELTRARELVKEQAECVRRLRRYLGTHPEYQRGMMEAETNMDEAKALCKRADSLLGEDKQ